MAVIPFYGADDPEMFAIERTAMDREGLVIGALEARLPTRGRVLDVGAGDGFTGVALQTGSRQIVALEPAEGMIRRDRPLTWVGGDAERLPFMDGAFEAAYATWAYFFTNAWDPAWDPGPGIAELHRTVKPGGALLIVDNLGGDELTALSSRDLTSDPEFWARHGFSCTPIATHFDFRTIEDARKLLGFYFGEAGRRSAKLRVAFRAGLFTGVSRGPGG